MQRNWRWVRSPLAAVPGPWRLPCATRGLADPEADVLLWASQRRSKMGGSRGTKALSLPFRPSGVAAELPPLSDTSPGSPHHGFRWLAALSDLDGWEHIEPDSHLLNEGEGTGGGKSPFSRVIRGPFYASMPPIPFRSSSDPLEGAHPAGKPWHEAAHCASGASLPKPTTLLEIAASLGVIDIQLQLLPGTTRAVNAPAKTPKGQSVPMSM